MFQDCRLSQTGYLSPLHHFLVPKLSQKTHLIPRQMIQPFLHHHFHCLHHLHRHHCHHHHCHHHHHLHHPHHHHHFVLDLKQIVELSCFYCHHLEQSNHSSCPQTRAS